MGNKAFAKAETALLEAHKLLVAGYGDDSASTAKSIKLLIALFDTWHAAEPDKGYDAKAAKWRAKLRSVSSTNGTPLE